MAAPAVRAQLWGAGAAGEAQVELGWLRCGARSQWWGLEVGVRYRPPPISKGSLLKQVRP